ncbi:MAG: leucine dehydrogenase [Mycoplasmataceae bacterium]|nr:leucine dehydrogenase [Mycoplasmataceae bacterium]
MSAFKTMEKYGYEQLVYFHDKTTGLKGITCIHNTVLGPGLGGTRLWNYTSEEDAVTDVMRLARGMTYKNAAAGLNSGGAKTVLIGDPTKVKSEGYFRALGRFIQSLNGRYITAEDVNTTAKDMDYINMETDYVSGLEGKSGNPSPVTAWGVFRGIQASLKEAFKDDDVSKYSYAIQGAGQTGYFLINYLIKHGVKTIYFTELNPNHIARMKKEHPEVTYVEPDKIYGLDVDVFAPCALGAVLNDDTIPKIKAKVVAGSANNVLKDEVKHGDMLKKAGKIYAPDFVINGGGVINVWHELIGYNHDRAMRDVDKIYDRILEIFQIAKTKKINTQLAAIVYAEQRIQTIGEVRKTYVRRCEKNK